MLILLYSIGCEIFLPDVFTTNAQRYGLIGIAFGIVTYLFGYASIVVVTAIVAGAWDRRRALEQCLPHHEGEAGLAPTNTVDL